MLFKTLSATAWKSGASASSTQESEWAKSPVARWVVEGKKPDLSTLSASKWGLRSARIWAQRKGDARDFITTAPSRDRRDSMCLGVVFGSRAERRVTSVPASVGNVSVYKAIFDVSTVVL